jgi:hypothetical protein
MLDDILCTSQQMHKTFLLTIILLAEISQVSPETVDGELNASTEFGMHWLNPVCLGDAYYFLCPKHSGVQEKRAHLSLGLLQQEEGGGKKINACDHHPSPATVNRSGRGIIYLCCENWIINVGKAKSKF